MTPDHTNANIEDQDAKISLLQTELSDTKKDLRDTEEAHRGAEIEIKRLRKSLNLIAHGLHDGQEVTFHSARGCREIAQAALNSSVSWPRVNQRRQANDQ